MPTLAITGDTVSARLEQNHLELIKRLPDSRELTRLHVPFYDIERVVLVGNPGISIQVLHKLMRLGIPVAFISAHHQWLGSLSSDNAMNAERRIAQYRNSENQDFRLLVSTELILCKIRNSRRVLQRLSAARKESELPAQQSATDELAAIYRKVERIPESMDALRGYEGLAAAVYFARLSDFFPEDMPFQERSRRPPLNEANSLLSWTYAVVESEIHAAIRAHGLDPYLGFLHETSYNMPSLVLDLIEPLRAPLCDMLVMHLLNHRILRKEHFEFHSEDGGTYLKAEARKDFFPAYEATMTRNFTLTPGDPHVTFRKIIESQIITVLKALEGESSYHFFCMP